MGISQSLAVKLIDISYDFKYLVRSNQKHFSFIVQRNKILSVGFNNGWKTNPLAAKFGHRFSGIHSELAALINFGHNKDCLKFCKLVNIRISRGGIIGLAKPCDKCLKLLNSYSFKEIVYTSGRALEFKELL